MWEPGASCYGVQMRSSLALLFWALGSVVLVSACGDDDSTDEVMDLGPADASMATDAGPDCEPTGMIPLARGEHAAVMDAERSRILVYGGNVAVPVECMPATEYTDELWAFDLRCGSWTQLTSTGGPGVRARSAMVTSADGDKAYLFGGRIRSGSTYTNYADVWELDLSSLSWREITTSGTGPTPRSQAVIAHDATRNRLVVFGGNISADPLSIEGSDDTWAVDLSSGAWSRIAEDSPPTRRYAHAAAHQGDTFYVFGGSPNFFGPFTNDVWALDLATDTWSPVSGGGPGTPASRFGAALFAAGDQLVMVAGHDATDLGNVNDIWVLDIASGTWTEPVHGDELTGTALGPCDFPADFTSPDVNAPERRHYFGAVQGGGRGYVVMGKTDCGNVNDVWSVDLETPEWSLVGQATTSGEACNRSGATTCTSLCF